MSPNGKTNPKDELIQTVKKLLNEKSFDDSAIACKFPARKNWLKKKLNIQNFPKVTCKEYDTWFKQLDPVSASLIFPSAHINSPASMFGHTFLRINSSYNSKLLSHAINYAASADQDTENGFIFAIKGLFGGYYGQYSLLPYYEKLKEYRDTEQRDIWEYDLNLTKDEVIRMVTHIWELKNSYSNYYFFDENCSYNMLWLLEIARPSIKLRDKFTYHVSPPETVFEIISANLVEAKSYRPSKRKVLIEYEKYFNDKDILISKKLAKGTNDLKYFINNNHFSLRKKQLILEASTELAEYYYIQGKIDKKSYLNISHNLSKQRALLGTGEKIKISQPKNPDQAHRQLSLFLGYKHNTNNNFITFGIRPTYHDITNNDVGFLAGTQIEFLTPQFFYNTQTNSVKVDYLKLLTITSLAPQTKFFKPLSWSTSWQFNRDSLNEELNFNAKISGGQAYFIGDESFIYGLIDGYIYPTKYSNSAAGVTVGAIIYTTVSSKLNLESNYKKFNNGDEQKTLNITQSYFPKSNMDIKLTYQYIEKMQKDQNNIQLSFHYFF